MQLSTRLFRASAPAKPQPGDSPSQRPATPERVPPVTEQTVTNATPMPPPPPPPRWGWEPLGGKHANNGND